MQGDCGGMIFRSDDDGHFYYFHICENGTYKVFKYVDTIAAHAKALCSSSSSAIHTGLGHQNKMAVVATGSTMTFYVNERQIDQEQDSSYTSGKIALIADPLIVAAMQLMSRIAMLGFGHCEHVCHDEIGIRFFLTSFRIDAHPRQSPD